MALTATVHTARLVISDLGRNVYGSHNLRIARHPSETDQRMMVRLLTFVLYASERLQFGRGLSDDDEPALWERRDDGSIARWIDVGLPAARRLRKACGRSEAVAVLAYGGRLAEQWWQDNLADLRRLKQLEVRYLPPDQCEALAALTARTMELQCTLDETTLWFDDGQRQVELNPERWL